MFNRSENSKLPPINLITIDGGSSKITDRSKHFKIPLISDLRWQKVQEFLKSTSLSKNTQTVYTRKLQRFLAWTDLSFIQIRSRHLANYKEYLQLEVKTPQGESLSKATVNSALANPPISWNPALASRKIKSKGLEALSSSRNKSRKVSGNWLSMRF
ncbi:MAG: phage integrase N-terminal SAM-like domain-containing protein [Scytonematopsis contorta HA4267-MV1]|nr:phage integrase N-terminal SAM-like domain-containing protein [Scytonematopsis contorta HA4267-MV1]